MDGDLEGEVTLDVSFDGSLQSNGSDGTERAPGTTVTGTATGPSGGIYDIDLTL